MVALSTVYVVYNSLTTNVLRAVVSTNTEQSARWLCPSNHVV